MIDKILIHLDKNSKIDRVNFLINLIYFTRVETNNSEILNIFYLKLNKIISNENYFYYFFKDVDLQQFEYIFGNDMINESKIKIFNRFIRKIENILRYSSNSEYSSITKVISENIIFQKIAKISIKKNNNLRNSIIQIIKERKKYDYYFRFLLLIVTTLSSDLSISVLEYYFSEQTAEIAHPTSTDFELILESILYIFYKKILNPFDQEKFIQLFLRVIQSVYNLRGKDHLNRIIQKNKRIYERYDQNKVIFERVEDTMLTQGSFQIQITKDFWKKTLELDLKAELNQKKTITYINKFFETLINLRHIGRDLESEISQIEDFHPTFDRIKFDLKSSLETMRFEEAADVKSLPLIWHLQAAVKLKFNKAYSPIYPNLFRRRIERKDNFQALFQRTNLCQSLTKIAEAIRQRRLSLRELYIIFKFKLYKEWTENFPFNSSREYLLQISQGYHAQKKIYNQIVKKVNLDIDNGSFQSILAFLTPEKHRMVRTLYSDLDLDTPVCNLSIAQNMEDLERFLQFRDLLSLSRFRKVFILLFILKTGICQFKILFRNDEEQRLALEYLKDISKPISEETLRSNQVDWHYYDRDRGLNEMVDQHVSLRNFNDILDQSHDLLVLLTNKYYSLKGTLDEEDEALLKGTAKVEYPFTTSFFRFLYYQSDPSELKAEPPRTSSKLSAVWVRSHTIERHMKTVDKLSSFGKIAENMGFVEENLAIYFSEKVKQQILTFQEKMKDRSQTLEEILKFYEQLPGGLRNAEDQKVDFITRVASQENYKGDANRRAGELCEGTVPGPAERGHGAEGEQNPGLH